MAASKAHALLALLALVALTGAAAARPLLSLSEDGCKDSEGSDDSDSREGDRFYVDVPGFNCKGDSLPGMPAKDVRSLADCKAACDAEPDCQAVTYDAEDDKCWLKSSCDYQEKDGNDSAVAAPRKYVPLPRGYGCVDNSGNLARIDGVESLEDCQAECDKNVECAAVTFNTDDQCYLKPECSSQEEKDTNDSSVASGSEFVDLPEGIKCHGANLGDVLTGVGSFGDCKDKCDASSLCFAVTYDGARDKCWLKGHCDEHDVKEGYQSAAKSPVAPFVDVPAGWNCKAANLDDMPLEDVDSLEECKDECDDDARCFAVSWKQNSNKCYLKTECKEYEENDDVLSAVKN